MAQRRVITRSEAERRIEEYQRQLLERYECFSTWELYADFGAGHCCGGIFRLRDAELRQLYRGRVPGIEKMEREAMLRAIIAYEMEQVRGPITCQAVARMGRVCDGLDRYTNVELTEWFREALDGAEVVDDPAPEEPVPAGRALAYLALLVTMAAGGVTLVLTFLS